MNVAEAAYLRGFEDSQEGRQPNPSVGLSEIETDNYN